MEGRYKENRYWGAIKWVNGCEMDRNWLNTRGSSLWKYWKGGHIGGDCYYEKKSKKNKVNKNRYWSGNKWAGTLFGVIKLLSNCKIGTVQVKSQVRITNSQTSVLKLRICKANFWNCLKEAAFIHEMDVYGQEQDILRLKVACQKSFSFVIHKKSKSDRKWAYYKSIFFLPQFVHQSSCMSHILCRH